MTNIADILKGFDAAALNSIQTNESTNRWEIKFCFPVSQLQDVLNELKAHYSCLEVNAERVQVYNTLYFDTKNHLFYHQHHNGVFKRQKVRRRYYPANNLVYLEVKNKNNKGQTQKIRTLVQTLEGGLHEEEKHFLKTHCQIHPNELEPALLVSYKRIALLNKTTEERLSFDFDISFDGSSEVGFLNGLVVAEIKSQDKAPSFFTDLMKTHGFRATPLSKYCLGLGQKHKHLKGNNFKAKNLYIHNQIENEHFAKQH